MCAVLHDRYYCYWNFMSDVVFTHENKLVSILFGTAIYSGFAGAVHFDSPHSIAAVRPYSVTVIYNTLIHSITALCDNGRIVTEKHSDDRNENYKLFLISGKGSCFGS